MSITTAKVAGVKNVIAASPPKDENGANPIIIYTANLCGADVIMNCGGIGAIGAFAYGLDPARTQAGSGLDPCPKWLNLGSQTANLEQN